MIEMDRILRPEGTVIIRDSPGMIAHVVKVAKAIRWSFEISESEPGAPGKEQIFVARKEFWKVDNIATQWILVFVHRGQQVISFVLFHITDRSHGSLLLQEFSSNFFVILGSIFFLYILYPYDWSVGNH